MTKAGFSPSAAFARDQAEVIAKAIHDTTMALSRATTSRPTSPGPALPDAAETSLTGPPISGVPERPLRGNVDHHSASDAEILLNVRCPPLRFRSGRDAQ